MRTTTAQSVTCPYCDQPAVFLRNSGELYHGRDYGPVWICRPCKAWVGTHKNDKDTRRDKDRPLGRLANSELRKARNEAHAAFDPIWKRGAMERKAAYRWLANELKIQKHECHIAEFDLERCRQVVEVCRIWGMSVGWD